jgi:hypothetical protein
MAGNSGSVSSLIRVVIEYELDEKIKNNAFSFRH